MREHLLVVVFLATAHLAYSTCDCWISEFIDDWTDDRSIGLVCMENESEAAIVLWAHETRGPVVTFHDPIAQARTGVLVRWEYRVGAQPPRTAHLYWNVGNPPGFIHSAEHMNILVDGIENGERILFRWSSRNVGETRTLQDCKGGFNSIKEFKPILENTIKALEEAQSEETDEVSATRSGYGSRAEKTIARGNDDEQ